MAEFFAATDEVSIRAAIDGLLSLDVPVEDVARELRQGRSYSSEVIPGWSIRFIEGADGTSRPYHVYVPASYDSATPAPVLFDLHGGRMADPVPADEHLLSRIKWQPSADKYGWILVYPQADAGATWFDETGQANLMEQLASLKRTYNIDENRVFMSGYSAGGAGSIWQALNYPTPWAGFLSFNGYFDIDGLGPYSVYPGNLLNRPIRATNGLYDGVIPIDQVVSFVEQFQAMGIDITWQIYPVAHNISFLEWERAATEAFLLGTVRDPYREDILWQTSSPVTGRCDWVRIDEIADVGNNMQFEERNVYLSEEKSIFGVVLTFQGSGLYAVAGLQPGSIGQVIGVKTGDRILRIDEIEVSTSADMEAVVTTKLPGDPIHVEVLRDGRRVTLSGEIPRGTPAYSRAAVAGTVHAQAQGNEILVDLQRVARFTLFISSGQFDLSAPINVFVNGAIVYSQIVMPDLRFMLNQAAEAADRTAVYEAMIEIAVPERR